MTGLLRSTLAVVFMTMLSTSIGCTRARTSVMAATLLGATITPGWPHSSTPGTHTRTQLFELSPRFLVIT